MVTAAPGKKLVVADLSAIEARVIAWAAGDERKLNQFARHDITGKHEDEPYVHTASDCLIIPIAKVGKPERTIGKTSDLSLGYSMGDATFNGRLPHLSAEQCKKIVQAWRARHDKIVALWDVARRAAVRAVATKKPQECGPFTFECDGEYLMVRLPSGRLRYYAFPVLMNDTYGKRTVSYHQVDGRTHKWGPCRGGRGAYGGLLLQNAIQSTARDVLVEAMRRVEAAGYHVIMSVHDEIVAEVDERFGSVEEFVQLMCVQPSCAAGLPLNAKGWEGTRFG